MDNIALDPVVNTKMLPEVKLHVYGFNFWKIFNGALSDSKLFEQRGVHIHPMKRAPLNLIVKPQGAKAIYIGDVNAEINPDTCKHLIFSSEARILSLVEMSKLKKNRGAKIIFFNDGQHNYNGCVYYTEEVRLALIIAGIYFLEDGARFKLNTAAI